mmetsp:Transcript_110560/g.180348  ORF Transcript_110560/g.180348 Transcript_110560/m.180348 type:complete len:824 (-) Transcript_110560:221-2692(-)
MESKTSNALVFTAIGVSANEQKQKEIIMDLRGNLETVEAELKDLRSAVELLRQGMRGVEEQLLPRLCLAPQEMLSSMQDGIDELRGARNRHEKAMEQEQHYMQELKEKIHKLEQERRAMPQIAYTAEPNREKADNMLPGEVSKMIEVAIQAEVKDLVQRLTVLETQVVGQEHGVMTGPHPTDADLPIDQVVAQGNSVKPRPQPTDAGLPSDQDTLEKPQSHMLSKRMLAMEARTHCDHPLSESVWEGAILLRLPAIGIVGSAFLVIGLIGNVLFQVAFLYVVYHSFLVSTLPDVDSVWEWRELQGHHANNMIQATHSSLVRAICDSDPLLISAANQQDLHNAIVDYRATENFGIPLGGLLCTMVVCLWVMYIGQEFHAISSFVNAMLHLPHSEATQLLVSGEDVVLVSCSIGRVVFVLILMAVRLGIAGTLLTFGSIWLARTVSLQELVLNSCALAMVLDMDELIFASVVSRTVKVLVREIKPLKRSMGMRFIKGCSLEGTLFVNQFMVLLGALIFTLFIIVAYVLPSMQQMKEIDAAFCNGLKDFVFAQSSLQVIAATGSNDPSGLSSEMDFVREAVNDVIVGGASADEIYKVRRILHLVVWDDFNNVQVSSTGNLVQILTSQVMGTSCEDYDFAAPDAVPSFQATLRGLYGWGVNSCEDLEEHCPGEQRFLRMICPETCGCNLPLSGLYKKGPNQGCPAECAASGAYISQLANIPCMDYSLANLTQMPGYAAFVNQWLETWLKSQPREAERLQQAGAAMLTYGCVAIGLLPARIQSMFCQPTSEYGSLNAYCPMSCDCISSALEDCPVQCSSMFTYSNTSQ